MLDSAGVLIGIGLYFAGMIFIGYIMKNKNKGAEDFLVGGRSFNMFFNTGTLVACLLGGTVVIALPGVLYSHGIWDGALYYGGHDKTGFGSADLNGVCCRAGEQAG